MKTIEELNLTMLETLFVKNLIPMLYAETGFTDVEVKEISGKMGVEVDSAKGVLGSLVKKGICETQLHAPTELRRVGKRLKLVTINYEFIALAPDYYHLHPNWNKEWLR